MFSRHRPLRSNLKLEEWTATLTVLAILAMVAGCKGRVQDLPGHQSDGGRKTESTAPTSLPDSNIGARRIAEEETQSNNSEQSLNGSSSLKGNRLSQPAVPQDGAVGPGTQEARNESGQKQDEQSEFDNRWNSIRGMDIDQQRAKTLGIRKLSGRHVTIYTDVRDSTMIDELPAVFDLAVDHWCRYFGFKRKTADAWRLSAFVVNDRQKFRDAGLLPSDLPDFLAGFQRGREMWVYLQDGKYYTRHLLLHEGTHAFMSHFLGGTGAAWYSEGMAELLAVHRWQDDQLKLKYRLRDRTEAELWGRVRLIKDANKSGRPIPTIEEVVSIDPTAFRQVESYAWAWALCEFLDSHPTTQAAFRNLPAVAANVQGFQRELMQQQWVRDTTLSEDWQLFIHEIEYGYDVARASVGAVKVEKQLDSGLSLKLATDRGWQSTGIKVQKGQQIQITADGKFEVARDSQSWPCSAAGVTIEYYAGRPLGRLLAGVRTDSDSANSASGLLQTLDVGRSATIEAPFSGILCLRINESPAKLDDNRGEISVHLRFK